MIVPPWETQPFVENPQEKNSGIDLDTLVHQKKKLTETGEVAIAFFSFN